MIWIDNKRFFIKEIIVLYIVENNNKLTYSLVDIKGRFVLMSFGKNFAHNPIIIEQNKKIEHDFEKQ